MTRTFCDRCKQEITSDLIIHHFQLEGDSCENTEADICDSCFKAFKSFMNMEDSLYHTNYTNHDILHNPGSNHGIERTTFGSK